jgi:hypothetical protein
MLRRKPKGAHVHTAQFEGVESPPGCGAFRFPGNAIPVFPACPPTGIAP